MMRYPSLVPCAVANAGVLAKILFRALAAWLVLFMAGMVCAEDTMAKQVEAGKRVLRSVASSVTSDTAVKKKPLVLPLTTDATLKKPLVLPLVKEERSGAAKTVCLAQEKWRNLDMMERQKAKPCPLDGVEQRQLRSDIYQFNAELWPGSARGLQPGR